MKIGLDNQGDTATVVSASLHVCEKLDLQQEALTISHIVFVLAIHSNNLTDQTKA